MSKGITSLTICIMMQITLFSLLIVNSNPAISDTVVYEGQIASDTIWDIGNSPYFIEGNITVSEGVKLTIEAGCEVRFNGYYGLFIEGNLSAEGSPEAQITFTSNRSSPTMNDWRGVQIDSKGTAKIRYCSIRYSEYAIYLNESSENDIQSNIISDNFDGIYIFRSSNNTISYNDISNSIQYGIFLSRSSNNHIQNNNISNNWEGIRLFFSSNNNISYNNIHDNPEAGIHLYSSESNNITSNSLISNGNFGVRLRFNSDNNIITKNNISTHANGINLTSSSKNRIYENLLWNNEF
ncbi:MAG: right-handed parallel beta-helix repeat-containing protein [Thermoplasmata archaeon]|nr:MAG: right-handed parallel beta-helix repeat-containing protein [Thermoplasmata archaeon]